MQVKLCIGIHVDDPVAAGESLTLKKAWLELQAHMMLRHMEHMMVDRPIEYLGREYQLFASGTEGVWKPG